MSMTITEEEKRRLLETRLDNGMTAWDYAHNWSGEDRPWIIAGILSCMKKDYGMTVLEVNWEARDLRSAKSRKG